MKLADIHSEIQTGILNYLTIHPNSLASIDDISKNWLADEKVEHNTSQVQTAVNRLVDHGELNKRLGGDFYSL